MTKKPDILLVGTGAMACEYAKVLKAQRRSFITIGRGETSARQFQETTGMPAMTGGIRKWLSQNTNIPKKVIVAVSEDTLSKATLSLLKAGAKSILVEKPGGFTPNDIRKIQKISHSLRARVYVAYNRRFYTSVEAAKRIISKDGGVTSFNFEFTEWSHVIAKLQKAPGVKARWFLHNSTHVIDLAFFLGGLPKKMTTFTAGALPWHPAAAAFAGAGVTANGALFSYQANWAAPGRWGVEVLTRKHRLYFRPMEKLSIQELGSVAINEVQIADALDTRFKPGLYKQVAAFFTKPKLLCSIREQVKHLPMYEKMLYPSR